MRRSLARPALLALAVLTARAAGALPAAPARAAAAPVARCATSGLVVWLDTSGNGAAGSVFYRLQLTNLSRRTCTVFGFPGVSAVDLAGHQLGSAASRNPSTVRSVRLPPGATASAELRIVQVVNIPAARCRRVTAAGLRVFPPDQTASKVVPFPFQACSRRGPIYSSVSALKRSP